MQQQEADALALKLSTSWQASKIGPNTWADQLLDLHVNQAAAAIRNLVRDDESPPSIARFMHAYKALAAPRSRDGCESCDGTGWIQVLDYRRHATACVSPHVAPNGGPCACSAVEPCSQCADGNHARVNIMPKMASDNKWPSRSSAA